MGLFPASSVGIDGVEEEGKKAVMAGTQLVGGVGVTDEGSRLLSLK